MANRLKELRGVVDASETVIKRLRRFIIEAKTRGERELWKNALSDETKFKKGAQKRLSAHIKKYCKK